MRTLHRVFTQQPLAAKVPEVTALFWVIKISTTAAGEAISDMFVNNKKLGVVVEVSMFVVALVLQFAARRYSAIPYWFLALAIAIGRDGRRRHHAPRPRHALRRHHPLLDRRAGRSLLPVEPQRAHARHPLHHHQPPGEVLLGVVFATFALGTALGDFTASTLGLGYLASAILFCVVILIPWAGWRFRNWNEHLLLLVRLRDHPAGRARRSPTT